MGIKNWWDGKYISHENDPSSGFFIIGGYTERHWTSRYAHAAVDFLKTEWKWAIGTVIALIGLLVAIKKL
jgi:hypothetical protein